ncbi:MAG: isochorismate synthase [Bacteroidota bacterium]|nr:isochorismate synthase [Bacteroidota bacterium]
MTDQLIHIDLINKLTQTDSCFALYRLPGEESIRLVYQASGQPTLIRSISELNSREGFVFAPFQITEKHPLLLINPEKHLTGWEAIGAFLSTLTIKENVSGKISDHSPQKNTKSTYLAAFEKFIGALQSGRFNKLVLSRCTAIARQPDFSPAEAFLRACAKYSGAFVYLCHTPVSGTWMGSTPEVLLKGGHAAYQTVALAGTRKAKTDCTSATRWDHKNKNEQSLVALYLREVLSRNAESWSEEKTETLTAGNVVHLKTGFSFSYPTHGKLGDLLQQLHPTPAVCGLPKEEAYHFILTEEGYDREYYSGFTGYLSADNQTDLYVNLRCMKIEAGDLKLFAGGGLLPSSSRETEWKETEEKLKTMRGIL